MPKYLFVGDAGTIRQRDHFGSWSARTSGVATDLRFITGTADGPLYVGGVETLLKSADSGDTWQDLSSGIAWIAGEYISQIHILDATNIYLMTDQRLFHWDGAAAFTVMATSADVSGFQGFVGCWAFATDDVWVCAYDSPALGDTTLHWDGATWTYRRAWYPGRFWADSNNKLYMKGATGIGSPRLVSWNGVDWAAEVVPAGYVWSKPFPSIHGCADDCIVSPLADAGSKIGVMRWDGLSWTTTEIDAGDASGMKPNWVHASSPESAAIAMTLGRAYIQTAAPETWVREDSATTGTSEDLYGVFGFGGPSITGLDKDVLSDAGGEVVTISGQFEVGVSYRAYIGPTGDSTDTPMRFVGRAKGEALTVTSASTIQVVTPPHSKGAGFITLDDGALLDTEAVNIVERNWPNRVFNLRRAFERWIRTGPRTLDQEPVR